MGYRATRRVTADAPTSARERYTAFRKAQPRSPRLTRRTVRARGLDFAVFTTPEVPGMPPLVCVNGGMIYSHALVWPALSPLAASRQLILYDQRGRGASAVPPAAQQSRIEYDAGDLEALRPALGVERWDVLGHSWGGGIAMLAAARDVLGVRRLVLVDAVGATSDWIASLHTSALARLDGRERAILEALDPRLLHDDNPETHAEYSRAIYPAWFADRELGAGFAPPREMSRTGSAVASRLRREGYDWRAEVGRITASALVLHGAQDLISPTLATATAALIPGANVALIEGSGHMPFWEQPALFFAHAQGFLDARDRGA